MFRYQILFYLSVPMPSNHFSASVQPSQAYPQTSTISTDVVSPSPDYVPKLTTFTSNVLTLSTLMLPLNCLSYA